MTKSLGADGSMLAGDGTKNCGVDAVMLEVDPGGGNVSCTETLGDETNCMLDGLT